MFLIGMIGILLYSLQIPEALGTILVLDYSCTKPKSLGFRA